MIRQLSSLVAITLLAFSAAAQQAPKSETKAAAAESTPSPALYEVKSGKGVAFLFGTLHVGKREFYPLSDIVERAFKESDVLVVEADITNLQGLRESAPLMQYAAPDALSKKLPATLYERFKKQATRFGVPVEEVDRMRPFMAASALTVGQLAEAGYEPRYGVDGYFLEAAQRQKKPIRELEGLAAQMKLFGNLSDADQHLFLENTLTGLETGKASEQVDAMVGGWRFGNVDVLKRAVDEYNASVKDAPRLDDKLIYGRHDAMITKIADYLASGQVHFVAVGSLHLIGPKGLPALLEKKGFAVRRIDKVASSAP